MTAINQYADQAINKFSLEFNVSKEIKTQVKKCISRYTCPDSFSDRLSWGVFRIWNAIKAIFGRSEWQKTRKPLKEFFSTVFFNEIINEGIAKLKKVGGGSLDDLLIKEIKEMPEFSSICTFVAKLSMDLFLRKNHKKINSEKKSEDVTPNKRLTNKLDTLTNKANKKFNDTIKPKYDAISQIAEINLF